MSFATHVNESQLSFDHLTWFIAHTWIGTNTNESWHTYAWVMPHIGLSNATLINEYTIRCQDTTNSRNMWNIHTWLSHGTYMNASCRTYDGVMQNSYMSTPSGVRTRRGHVTHVNESCYTCEWVMLHMWMSRVKLINEYTIRWQDTMKSQTTIFHRTSHLIPKTPTFRPTTRRGADVEKGGW